MRGTLGGDKDWREEERTGQEGRKEEKEKEAGTASSPLRSLPRQLVAGNEVELDLRALQAAADASVTQKSPVLYPTDADLSPLHGMHRVGTCAVHCEVRVDQFAVERWRAEGKLVAREQGAACNEEVREGRGSRRLLEAENI